MQIGESGANLKGTPEEVAERLIKEEGGQELKERELDLKGAEIKPGVAGSGIKRGEPAAVAQVREFMGPRQADAWIGHTSEVAPSRPS